MSIILDIINGKTPVTPQKGGAISQALGGQAEGEKTPLDKSTRELALSNRLTPDEARAVIRGEKIEKKLHDTDMHAYQRAWLEEAESESIPAAEKRHRAEMANIDRAEAERKEREFKTSANSKMVRDRELEARGIIRETPSDEVLPQAPPTKKMPSINKLRGEHTSSAKIPGQQ